MASCKDCKVERGYRPILDYVELCPLHASVSPSGAEQLSELRRVAEEAIKVLKLEFPGSIKRKAAIAQLEAALKKSHSQEGVLNR